MTAATHSVGAIHQVKVTAFKNEEYNPVYSRRLTH